MGGGERGGGATSGGAGGEVIWGYQTLTGTTGCTVTIGAGGSGSNDANGGETQLLLQVQEEQVLLLGVQKLLWIYWLSW